MEQNKKIIKINYCGFWDSFDPNFNLLNSVLKERYNIIISDNPDFVFCSPLGKPLEYMKYDCVRILYSGEPLSPDFNIFDYAMAFDFIEFGDRYLRYPLSIWRNIGECHFREPLSEEDAVKLLQKKKFFCNFIQGHRSDSGLREQLFNTLNEYKRVESAGTFMNNQVDNKTVFGESKIQLLKECKFSICSESLEYPGFTTEKISHGFECCSIPIYLGDPLISKVYNNKAFINCSDYNNDLNAVLERVKEIDNDDKLYIEILCEPITQDPDFCHKQYEKLCDFLYNIFDQEPEKAFRRIRHYCAAQYEGYAKEYAKWNSSFSYRFYKKFLYKKNK